MDIVLGVSMTPATVRMVLVEGENADGVTVDYDVFDISAVEGGATTSASDQVIAAVLGTQESAAASGHDLKSIGVTWSDHGEAARLRDSLAARGIEDVMLVSELHAAAALAQAVGRAVGYEKTALFFIDHDTATLSVVQTGDGSVVKVLSRSLHSADAMAVLTEMAAAIDAESSPPEGMFVVGAGVDVTSVKAHLENLVSLPIKSPEEPELALARGAALASAHAPRFEASTVGLAYSQDPLGSEYPVDLAADGTQLAGDNFAAIPEDLTEGGRKPFLLVGSALTSIFVVGVVALVISLAVSIRPTVDQRPTPGTNAIVPTMQAPPAPALAAAPPVAQEMQPVEPPPPPAPAPVPAPVPVVQEAPRAQVVSPPVVRPEPPAAPAPAAEPAALPLPPPDAPPIAPPPAVLPPAPQFQPGFQPPGQQEPPTWRSPWRSMWRPMPQEPEYPQYPQGQGSQYPQYPQYPQGQGQGQYPQESPASQYPQGQYPQGPGAQYPQGPQDQQYPPYQPTPPQRGCILMICFPVGGH